MSGTKDRSDTGFKRFLVFKELTARRSVREYIALFSYFSFHGWIRLAFAEGPRQVINLLTLIALFRADLIPKEVKQGEEFGAFVEFFKKFGALADKDLKQALVIGAMAFSLLIWVFSVLKVIIASCCYVGFLWHIMANSNGLYAYCKERIDKRMKEVVHDKMKERYKNQIAKQPTVANIALDEKPKLSIPTPTYTPNSGSNFSSPQTPQQFGVKRTNTSSSTANLLSNQADMGYSSNPGMSRMPSKASMNSQFTSSSGYPQTPLPPYDISPNRPYTPGSNGSPAFGPPSRSNTDMSFGPPQRSNTDMGYGPQNPRPGQFTRPGPQPGIQRANTGFDGRGPGGPGGPGMGLGPGMGRGPGIQRANTDLGGPGMGMGPGIQRANTDLGGPNMGMGPGNGYNRGPGMGMGQGPRQPQPGYSPNRPVPPYEEAGFDFNGSTVASSAYSGDQRSMHNGTPANNFRYDDRLQQNERFPVRTGTPASQLSVQTGMAPTPVPRILTPANDRLRRQGSQDSTYSQGSRRQQQQQQHLSPQGRDPSPNRGNETDDEFDVLAEYGGPSPEEERPRDQFPAQQQQQQRQEPQEPQRPFINQPISRVNTAPVAGAGTAPLRVNPPQRSQTARPEGNWEHAVDRRW